VGYVLYVSYVLYPMCHVQLAGSPVGPVSGHLSFMWRNALPNCVQIAHADNSFSLRHIKAFAIVPNAPMLLLLWMFWPGPCQIVTPTRAALCSSCQQTETSTSTSTSTGKDVQKQRHHSNRHSFVQFNAGQGHFALQYPPGHPIPAHTSPSHR